METRQSITYLFSFAHRFQKVAKSVLKLNKEIFLDHQTLFQNKKKKEILNLYKEYDVNIDEFSKKLSELNYDKIDNLFFSFFKQKEGQLNLKSNFLNQDQKNKLEKLNDEISCNNISLDLQEIEKKITGITSKIISKIENEKNLKIDVTFHNATFLALPRPFIHIHQDTRSFISSFCHLLEKGNIEQKNMEKCWENLPPNTFYANNFDRYFTIMIKPLKELYLNSEYPQKNEFVKELEFLVQKNIGFLMNSKEIIKNLSSQEEIIRLVSFQKKTVSTLISEIFSKANDLISYYKNQKVELNESIKKEIFNLIKIRTHIQKEMEKFKQEFTSEMLWFFLIEEPSICPPSSALQKSLPVSLELIKMLEEDKFLQSIRELLLIPVDPESEAAQIYYPKLRSYLLRVEYFFSLNPTCPLHPIRGFKE